MSGKSRDAFRTISEVAEHLEIPAHVLRFWETKFTQVRPLKRNGGRRYYRPGDIEMLERIRDLLHKDGFTIKGAQKHLAGRGGRAQPASGASSKATALCEAHARLLSARESLATLRSRLLR